jgi:Uma2 family endonuclease
MSVTIVHDPPSHDSLDEGVRPRRWTRAEYHRAADLGLFQPEERLELLDGEILQKMSPQKSFHAYVVLRAADVLARAFGPGHHARPQLPLILHDASEPEPDLTIVVGTAEEYVAESPHAAHARLVVEVSDTTLRLDSGRKRRAYARAGITEYWIVNLRQRQLEVHRDPQGARYRSVTIYREHETVTPLFAPQATIRVADLLPPTAAEQR